MLRRPQGLSLCAPLVHTLALMLAGSSQSLKSIFNHGTPLRAKLCFLLLDRLCSTPKAAAAAEKLGKLGDLADFIFNHKNDF